MNNYIKKWKSLNKLNRFNVSAIVFIQLAFVTAFILAIHEKDWLTSFLALVALVIVWLPPIIEKNLKIHFPLEFGFILNLFIYASLFLGEQRGYYTAFVWWDVVLHMASAIALGFIGFLIMYSIYRTEKVKIPRVLIVIFSFCFAVSLGAMWEIFEFFMDSTIGSNMQASGLVDTMWDLIVDVIGSLIVALSGYFYIKQEGKKSGVFKKYINIYYGDRK